jgi:hypothetical protein
MELGFECGPGEVNPCRSIDAFKNISDPKPNLTLPSPRNMRVQAGLSFHLISGLDLAVLFKSYSLFTAILGPRQDLNLAAYDAQAYDKGYASDYDLKIQGKVGLGSHAKKFFESLGSRIAKTTVDLSLTISYPLASSSTGALSASKSQVNVNEQVRFTVDLDPANITYFGSGYNVSEVQIYRLTNGGEPQFMTTLSAAANQTRFTWDWTPTAGHKGANSFVAFVVSKGLPFIPLEVKKDSTTVVTVGEGSWTGTITYTQVETQSQTDEDEYPCSGGGRTCYTRNTLQESTVIEETWTLTGAGPNEQRNYPANFVMDVKHSMTRESYRTGYNSCGRPEGGADYTDRSTTSTEVVTANASLSAQTDVRISFNGGNYLISANTPNRPAVGSRTWQSSYRTGPGCYGDYDEGTESATTVTEYSLWTAIVEGPVDPQNLNVLSGSEVVFDERWDDIGLHKKIVVTWNLTRK